MISCAVQGLDAPFGPSLMQNIPGRVWAMSRRSITARALAAAALSLAALWPLGSSAAGQNGAVFSVSGMAKTAGLRASAPAAAAMPASFRGQWTPISTAFASNGPLTLGARTLRWSICGKAERRIKPQVTDGGQPTAYPAFEAASTPQTASSGQQVLIDLTANGAPPCNLDGQPVTHLRLKQGSLTSPGNVCEMEVTLYGKGPQAAQPAQPELLGWGTFTAGQLHCGSSPSR